ncbi:MAG: hypothetical protein J5606_05080 [Bacteroidales bacterium]|nr:hypothetical protein [Bacteroidales bacterium]
MKKYVVAMFFVLIFGTNSAQIPTIQIQKVEATYTSISLTWDSVPQADGYEIVVINKKQIHYYTGVPSIVLNENIKHGSVYSIYIRAYQFRQNAHSEQVSYCLLTPPLALLPKIKHAKQTIVARWKRQFKSFDYSFYLARDSLFSKPVQGYNGLPVKKNHLPIKDLESGTDYYYRLETVDLNQKVHYSNTVNFEK